MATHSKPPEHKHKTAGPHHPKVVVVDEQDNIIGHKSWSKLDHEDIHRASFLWLSNSKGQVLLSKRSQHVTHPGLWTAAVSGTVQEGESYDENIYKEAAEEIGLAGVSFNLGPKLLISVPDSRFFIQWYFAVLDRDSRGFHLQETEVAQVKWIGRDEFQSDLVDHPEKYTPAVPLWAHLWA
jgi:isopentenyldiphosphate isomerase